MNLDRLQTNESVLIDANVLIYAIQKESPQCERFVKRCARGEITGVLSLHVLAEVMHHLMITEARDNGWITGSNHAKQLAQKPDRIRSLSRYENVVRDILTAGFQLVTLERDDFLSAISIQNQFGLLTNDALCIAVAQRLRLKSIASADQAFAQVRGVILYEPDDL